MTHTTTNTTYAMIADAASAMGIVSDKENGLTPSAYTLGYVLALSHMDYVCCPSASGVLVYQENCMSSKHVYLVKNDGTVLDVSGMTAIVLTGKRAIALTFYVDAAMSVKRYQQVIVRDMSMVARAFRMVVSQPARHL